MCVRVSYVIIVVTVNNVTGLTGRARTAVSSSLYPWPSLKTARSRSDDTWRHLKNPSWFLRGEQTRTFDFDMYTYIYEIVQIYKYTFLNINIHFIKIHKTFPDLVNNNCWQKQTRSLDNLCKNIRNRTIEEEKKTTVKNLSRIVTMSCMIAHFTRSRTRRPTCHACVVLPPLRKRARARVAQPRAACFCASEQSRTGQPR